MASGPLPSQRLCCESSDIWDFSKQCVGSWRVAKDREESPGAPEPQISPQAPKSEALPKRFFSRTHAKGPICTVNLRISRTPRLGIPLLVSCDHGIEDRQQFSHCGDDGGHFGFPFLEESLVEVPNSRV